MPEEEGDKPLNYLTSLLALKPRQILLAEQQHRRQLIKECGLTMVNKQPQQVSNCSTGKTELKPAVLKSILSYLHKNGFPKTLKRFLKEARIESDDWKTTSVDLEDVYARYAVHGQNSDVKIKGSLQEDETAEKDVSGLCTAEETSSKKKKKKKEKKIEENSENDVPAKCEPVEHSKSADSNKTNVKDTATKGKSKEKKSKSRSDSVGRTNDDTDEAIGNLKGAGSINEQDDKSKKDGSSLSQSVESKVKDTEILPVVSEKKNESSVVANGHDKINEGADKAKDKKEKKKRQMVAHVDDGQLGKIKTADYDDGTDVPQGNGKANSKEKKKKTVSENNESEFLDNAKSLESGDRKVSKKRKSAACSDGGERPVEDLVNGESKRRKIAEVGDHHTEKSEDEEAMIKGDKLKDGVQQSSEPKSLKKERSISSEPRTVNAFQRVKVEEVKFVDDRLQNNSYWAKDGAEYGYGAKAQEVLGQVKGKDFRHEKTKKKRGSYRGGQIDFQAHSVKFNYSDEE